MVGEKGAVTPRALVVGVVAAVVVVVGVAAFLLRGNGSDGAVPVGTPTSPASTSPSATVSPSVSPTESAVVAPVLPDAATKPTRSGAVAYVRFFWDTFNYSYRSLDSAPFRALSEPSCKSCLSYADAIDKAKSRGERFEGGTVVVVGAVAAPGDLSKGALVTVLLRQTSGATIDGSGVTVSTAAAVPAQRLDTALRWEGSRWTVLGMDSAR